MADLFNNNTSNDYIVPNLASCPGSSDSNTFEFLNGPQAGIVSGSSILMALSLSDFSQEITSWVQQKQLIQPGEVVFVQGLTKGISYRTQYYPIDGSVAYYSYLDSLYMSVDMSINYYKNFKYYEKKLHITSDETLGIDIASAMNIEFDAQSIGISATYDSSKFTFTGSTAGYNFNITAIDASRWVPDTSTVGNFLTEDISSGIPAFKYPNSAMLGYLLKVTYSNSETDDSKKYININHVPDYLTYYEASTGDPGSYIKYYKAVDVGMNGLSNSDTLSAGDYLSIVDEENKWEKVGSLRIWFTAEDPTDSNLENLITGFYLYNPNTYAVQIEYIVML